MHEFWKPKAHEPEHRDWMNMKSNQEASGRIVAVSTSRTKGVKKKNIMHGKLIKDHGLENDAHAGKWHRQVSLLAIENIRDMQRKGLDVAPGDFAENITTEGLALWKLPLGTRLSLGDTVLVEVTQIGKTCHSRCAIYYQVGDCMMPRNGIFARVLKGGVVKPGYGIRILKASYQDDTKAARARKWILSHKGGGN
jgi:MOSC domain-containing protein YiiM